MLGTYYCWKWSRHDKEPRHSYSEEQARAAYDSRSLYTALIDGNVRPRCFVECNMKALSNLKCNARRECSW
jgi:hypothetical protein